MLFGKIDCKELCQTRFSFGITSAIVTNLGLIVVLNIGSNAKLNIIAGILVIALADNIADSLGIHIYQESEGIDAKNVWVSTFTNFLSRLLVSLTFILLVLLLPLELAAVFAIGWGMILLSVVSYLIAQKKEKNVFKSILEHISIAALVVISSYIIRELIIIYVRF